MKSWRRALLAVAALAATVALAWGASAYLLPRPQLDYRRLQALVRVGRLDQAEELLDQHLRRVPDDSDAHLQMAELLLAGLDRNSTLDAESTGRAQRALEHLEHVRPAGPPQRALALVYRGKALYALRRWREFEQCMTEALRLDPRVPEAGWGLLDLYYTQGREREAHRLAMKLFEVEPDPHDRVQLLLELIRQDSRPPAPASLVALFEPAVRNDPEDLRSIVALGLAYIHNSEDDRGVDLLRRALDRHPNDPVAWEGLLAGLDEANRPEELPKVVSRLPKALADDPRFLRFRAKAEQQEGDAKAAIRDYRRALEYDPNDPNVAFRLGRALRLAGETAEAERWDRFSAAYKEGMKAARPLYEEANTDTTLGAAPHPDLYRRLGEHRESVGHYDEARAWYGLALKDRPGDPTITAALERVKDRP
jgi:tetratricopeptide (TPR) repeat protein